MGIIEILLISIGLSFDVFVVHICVGAGFSRKHGKDTLLSSLIFGCLLYTSTDRIFNFG